MNTTENEKVVEKIWINEGKDSEKIIVIVGNTIYKCNPKDEEINDFVQSLKMKMIPAQKTFGVPLPYIRELRYQEGQNYILILFKGNSQMHFRINDPERLHEVFDYFKQMSPGAINHIDRYTPLQAGKKPLVALLAVAALFAWAWAIASSMETGNEYDVSDGHYNSFAGLVLILASLGTTNVLLIFISLMAIAVTSFILKARKPPIIHRLIIKR